MKWSKIVAVSFDGGVVALTFGATRTMPTPSLKGSKERYQPPVHVTARLALAPGAAVELANALNKLLNTLIQIQKNLHEGLNPHSRYDLKAMKAGNLNLRHRNAHRRKGVGCTQNQDGGGANGFGTN